MSERPSDRKTPQPMAQRKSGLAVPPAESDQCNHQEIMKRWSPPPFQFVCRTKEGGCGEKVEFLVLQAVLVDAKQKEAMAKVQEAAIAKMQRRASGILLPGEDQGGQRPRRGS